MSAYIRHTGRVAVSWPVARAEGRMSTHNDTSNDSSIVDLSTDLETVFRRVASGHGGADAAADLIEDRDTLAGALAALPAPGVEALGAKTHAASVPLTTAGRAGAVELCRSVVADLEAFLAPSEQRGEGRG
jgi:hypothetical protein